MKNRLLRKFTPALVLLSLLFSSLGAAAPSARAADNDADSSAEKLLSWEATGPLGGDVRSLVIDPQDARRLYFGTIDGQIYTSADGGENWARVAGFNRPGLLIDNIIVDPQNSDGIYALTQSPKDPDVLLAGTNRGIWRSEDAGESWELLDTKATPGLISVES